jgi:hypothetical protein
MINTDAIWILPPWSAITISIVSICIVTISVAHMIKKARRYINKHEDIMTEKDYYWGSFWDIIRDVDYRPSLSLFQFFFWTVTIAFAFLSIYLIRIFGGETGFPSQIPSDILGVFVISIAVPFIDNLISGYKYGSSLSHMPLKQNEVPPVSIMLLEGNRLELYRFQMFLWTFLAIGIYLYIFSSTFYVAIADVEKFNACHSLKVNSPQYNQLGCANLKNPKKLAELSVPDVDIYFVIVMGLSLGGYLGRKLVARVSLRIDRIIKIGDSICILGNNFSTPNVFNTGGPGKVLINNKVVIEDTDTNHWKNNRIDLKLGEDIKLEKGSIVKVITNSSKYASIIYVDNLE